MHEWIRMEDRTDDSRVERPHRFGNQGWRDIGCPLPGSLLPPISGGKPILQRTHPLLNPFETTAQVVIERVIERFGDLFLSLFREIRPARHLGSLLPLPRLHHRREAWTEGATGNHRCRDRFLRSYRSNRSRLLLDHPHRLLALPDLPRSPCYPALQKSRMLADQILDHLEFRTLLLAHRFLLRVAFDAFPTLSTTQLSFDSPSFPLSCTFKPPKLPHSTCRLREILHPPDLANPGGWLRKS